MSGDDCLEKTEPGVVFQDLQAEIGITKHIGRLKATNELLLVCHIEVAIEVLTVGSGIRVGPVFIAKKFGCH